MQYYSTDKEATEKKYSSLVLFGASAGSTITVVKFKEKGQLNLDRERD